MWAIEKYREIAKTSKDPAEIAEAHYNAGYALEGMGRDTEATAEYLKVIINYTEIKSSDGDVGAVVAGEELRIKTSDGDIDLKIDGNMTVNLSTSDGNIMLSGPAELKADLNLKGERVRVIGGLNIDGEVGNHRVIGKLNNGGPKISARASDGTVALDLR